MPAGDGTGPLGLGPMTGRAAGYCAGLPVPGYTNPAPGWGFAGAALPGPYGAYGAYGAYRPAGYTRGMVPYGYGAGYAPAWGPRLGWFGRGFGRGRGGGFGRGRGRGRGGWW